MKILVVGSGGREHALLWKLSQSPEIRGLYCAPGNGGIGELAQLVDIGAEDIESLAEFAEAKDIDLTIVGPEGPLAKGIVDIFEKRGLRIFGPTKSAARLESSKAFSKNLLKKYHIPTGQFAVFDDAQAARSYVRQVGAPIVIKADGLCGGKGTIVAHTLSEALGAIDLLMEDRIFRQAGERIVVEERLVGEEVSMIVLTDGATAIPLLTSQDHKRLLDGDKGPNTGGMGAYAPAPVVTGTLAKGLMEQVIHPTLNGLVSEGILFKGVLYAGIMLTADGPKVLEFNVRFGDPEIQAILPLLKTDLVPLLDDTVEGRLSQHRCEWQAGSCVCVVLASGGYPGEFQIGKEIRGLERLQGREGVLVFHAGTKRDGERFVNWGGRALNVVAVDDEIEGAVKRAYDAIGQLAFDGMTYRKDIAWRALKKPVSH
ncbi:MAG TPA: phosphoribosylamine--glycine ligase [Candidatus Omnitrophica bacterium]|nr:MAG: phosphoribosylamine--glycine ligase [Omnitrophica WOR_2 bacterium GWA2_63_20]OGX32846.1 MAG: phosphoribosylamine--glycine ligase [Omnitrophica WOR_2 bacterium RIFCSPHIGHO2_12_FULL_64_13]OGX35607.1 MAG: phosphoribosylamine--glycine ligase [Omnitrophica WOR_2 bacterium RIFCSPHIGHO2_02_FULL_63_39]OGX46317.1 MAG: phosphoribosylamine--glycine ligase [Omnitrophica WOR_2 bacterium RIFCSPLOWO2_02_FULL_63_16]OGX47096.1 MAG: phosphoribosylamine--glycine ligase [Omnitrophica WOR_2 bacterium RIFCSP